MCVITAFDPEVCGHSTDGANTKYEYGGVELGDGEHGL
jgi:hypothetical protein